MSRTDEVREQFNILMDRYRCTIEATAGGGEYGQVYVDNAYGKIVEFCKLNPDYKHLLTKLKCHRVDNDGYAGTFTGITIGAMLLNGKD